MGDDKREELKSLEGISLQLSFDFRSRQIVGGLKRDIDALGIKVIDGIAYEFVFGGEPVKLGPVDAHGNIHYPRYGPIKKY